MGCFNSTVVSASADDVWAAMRKFHDMSWCPNVIKSLDPQGDPEQAGAKRVLNGVFFETLISIDDEDRVCTYSIDDGPDALSSDNVAGYVGQYQVFPVTADNTAFVLWTSTWKSSGGGVAEFCNPVYQALLGDLKSTFDAA